MECSKCGAAIPKSYAKDRFNLCDKCEDEAQIAFELYVSELTPDERRFLNWLYEGTGF